MSAAATLIALVLSAALASPALADDGWRFRLTTPRGELVEDGDDLFVLIPAGRAWGIASGLRLLPEEGTVASVDIEVRDPLVREAFLRVAYYERASGRPRQVLTVDSAAVAFGERDRVAVEIAPPEGAVAYRVRVLGRLLSDAGGAQAGAIAARDLTLGRATRAFDTRRTRLVMER